MSSSFIITTSEGISQGISTVLQSIWVSSVTPVHDLDANAIMLAAVLCLLLVAVRPVWRIARNAITIAHEGGHAVAALLTGRKLSGIQLHSDTSGVTVSYGKTQGFGYWLTCFAGYLAPALWGLGCAALVAAGYATGALWLLVILLALMLTRIRNGYGAASVIICLIAVVALSWWGSPDMRLLAATVLAGFLLLGSIRPLVELQIQRTQGRAGQSDADQLARLTHISALLWILLWLLIALIALWYSLQWITAQAGGMSAVFSLQTLQSLLLSWR
ncbi:M50 family metallopeptidase [Bifidobacterium psychraerophilum]|uniref:Integral membrane protein n=1 Tax=Bifidobacterium psychraerophilum TaxID=218140 RepID=A0A087CFQ8_9BIFI|nr:M50 family metallopeptidase [Bifidobacterium psychraerophilum]KFI82108.1 integral membrane protein [Bifidobacterium psychraerophilum]PKA94911.1 peptidase M50B-like protein [Bifidobacterium psychraerophilum DSM 22366]